VQKSAVASFSSRVPRARRLRDLGTR
jgi:hypothetical protein